jgi:hypothetical protein
MEELVEGDDLAWITSKEFGVSLPIQSPTPRM